MLLYVNSNNELVMVRTGSIYPIGTPKRNEKAEKALKQDNENGLITDAEYEEATRKLKNNLR